MHRQKPETREARDGVSLTDLGGADLAGSFTADLQALLLRGTTRWYAAVHGSVKLMPSGLQHPP